MLSFFLGKEFIDNLHPFRQVAVSIWLFHTTDKGLGSYYSFGPLKQGHRCTLFNSEVADLLLRRERSTKQHCAFIAGLIDRALGV